MNKRTWIGLSLLAMLWMSCGDTSGPTGQGDLRLSLAANEAVRLGFPHEENGTTLSFVDGWSVKLDTFAVSIAAVNIQEATPDGDGSMVAQWSTPTVVDIASDKSGQVSLTTITSVDAGRHDFGFRVAPPSGDVAGDATLGELMRKNKWSIVIRGTATPDANHPEFSEPISFDFGFPLDAEYFSCINGADGTAGVVIAANRQTDAYIYPHVVHLFWDKLGAGDEKLRFNAMARAAGEDGVVTMEELDGVDLLDPALTDESGVPLYDDAGLLNTYTLGAFIRRGMAESIHFNGIGFCKKRFGP